MTDEFELLAENVAEAGLTWTGRPEVRRVTEHVGGQAVSGILWGTGSPSLVLLHGGGQNAHTWDTVMVELLAADRGLAVLALDLPGHGHSDWRADHDYRPGVSAATLDPVLRRLAPDAAAVVGMSLGGLITFRLAASAPELVRRAVIVDVTPASPRRREAASAAQRGAVSLIDGPSTYASFEEMVEAAVAAAPHRSRASLRRGVLHNAQETGDGRWAWRYDSIRSVGDTAGLWDDISASVAPMTLVRGGASPFVTDADADELARRKPGLGQHVVAGAGHSVQSDAPGELAVIIRAAVPLRS